MTHPGLFLFILGLIKQKQQFYYIDINTVLS